MSVTLHSAVALALVIVPLVVHDPLPSPSDASWGFFPEPLDVPVPPPPPAPPPPGIRRSSERKAPEAAEVRAFVAPSDVSREITPDTIDLELPDGGEGVDGGTPGGPVGAIITGLPAATPPSPAPVVRISSLQAPRLVRKIAPSYPELARAARVTGVVVVEAEVDARGLVTRVRVLNGHPLLDRAAADAVEQWRYQPLLLGGVPTAFIVTVSVTFALTDR